uniref:Ycf36 n=1 Tax=Rhodogorgon sp. TaxID=2485824 RepID=A0A3G3MI35_9FLOR|nr:hypothetical protein [Rhodogorgon sp.]
MSLSKDICPVPFDQQPLNEYNSLKSSCFFSWFGIDIKSYIQSVVIITCTASILFMPLVNSVKSLSVGQCLVINCLLVTFTLIVILVRLYLGWSYVTKRLLSATIFYEESGWYDGQIWVKTADILTKDRLIGTYYVLPVLKRIRYTLGLLLPIVVIEFIIYCLL